MYNNIFAMPPLKNLIKNSPVYNKKHENTEEGTSFST